MNSQLLGRNFEGAISTCQRLLGILPKNAPERAAVLANLGTSNAMLQNYPESYTFFTEALALEPDAADLWYGRGIASRHTGRAGRSLREYERAVELEGSGPSARHYARELKFSRKLVQESLKMRGPNFTLDQLIEQEEHFQQGLRMMEAQKWKEAEQEFRRVIAMGDCLPQPWGNLGMSMLIQGRYDEAEAALKRALEIEPKYEFAKHNLALLPEIRQNGLPETGFIVDPYGNRAIEQKLTSHRK